MILGHTLKAPRPYTIGNIFIVSRIARLALYRRYFDYNNTVYLEELSTAPHLAKGTIGTQTHTE